jgi:hypothetical protein
MDYVVAIQTIAVDAGIVDHRGNPRARVVGTIEIGRYDMQALATAAQPQQPKILASTSAADEAVTP